MHFALACVPVPCRLSSSFCCPSLSTQERVALTIPAEAAFHYITDMTGTPAGDNFRWNAILSPLLMSDMVCTHFRHGDVSFCVIVVIVVGVSDVANDMTRVNGGRAVLPEALELSLALASSKTKEQPNVLRQSAQRVPLVLRERHSSSTDGDASPGR